MRLREMTPFILSLGGVLADYVTTTIGLGLGFTETHPQYHPLTALAIFWGAITVLTLTMPRRSPWNLAVHGIALVSFLGGVNNLLVILGVFPGLPI